MRPEEIAAAVLRPRRRRARLRRVTNERAQDDQTATRPALTPYQRRLFALLALATFFEGFDTKLAGLVLSPMGNEFGESQSAVFGALSLASVGAGAPYTIGANSAIARLNVAERLMIVDGDMA
jgi:hypothetical protein